MYVTIIIQNEICCLLSPSPVLQRKRKKMVKVQIFTECQWLDRSSHLLMLLLLLLLLLLLFIDVKLSLPSMDIETVSSID